MEGKYQMTTLIHLTVTEDEALHLRLALNATAMEWGDSAGRALENGDRDHYDTCNRIRTGYHHLWEKVAKAMEDTNAFNREAFNAAIRDSDAGESNERLTGAGVLMAGKRRRVLCSDGYDTD